MDHDTIFEVLRNPVRRQIVTVLHDKDKISRDRLATVLTAAEADDQDDTTKVRRRLRLQLHHNHLPRLADADLIEHDEETITPTPRLEMAAQSLPVLDRNKSNAQV